MKTNFIVTTVTCLLFCSNLYANQSASESTDSNLQLEIDIPKSINLQSSKSEGPSLKALSGTVTNWTLNNTTMTEGDSNALTFTLDQSVTNTSVRFFYTGTFNGTTYNTPTLIQSIDTSAITQGTHNFTATQDTTVEAPQTLTITTSANDITNASSTHTVTIVDDDNANVSLLASTNTLNEASGSVTLTATLDKPSYEPITVNLGFSGTSTGSDYSTSSNSITIAAGDTTGTSTITATQDALVETNETIIVDITSVSGGRGLESGTQQQTLSITDDDSTTVQLLASTTQLTEGTSGVTTLTAQLDAATYEDVTVNLVLSGTGTSGSDYTLADSTLTISAGNTQATTTLTILDDSTVEQSETAIVDISTVSGGKANENGTQQQSIALLDNDTPSVQLLANTTELTEAAVGSTTLTAQLSTVTYEDVIVNLALSGTGTSGSDYTLADSTLTISAGNTQATTTLTIVDDSLVEQSETAIIDISTVSGGKATENGTQQQSISLLDDDTPSVQLLASTTELTETAVGSTTLTAQLNTATFEDVTVNLTLSGTATSGSDYTLADSTLTISAGNTQATTTLTIIDDSAVEQSETTIVDISSVSGGKAIEDGTQQQTISLLDNDSSSVQLLASTTQLTEGSNSSTTLTAQLDAATYEDVTVNLALSGTGTNGSDYALADSTLTISAGNTQASTTLTIEDDNIVELSETVLVDISAVSGGKATENGTQQQSITLADNDSPIVTLSVASQNIDEGSSQALVSVNLDKATFEAVNVTIATQGTASNGTDYTIADNSVTINPGDTQASFSITIIDDSTIEDNETIILSMSSINGGKAAQSGSQQLTLTIIENDINYLTLTQSDTSMEEAAGHVTVSAHLTRPSNQQTDITLKIYGLAQQNVDYQAASNVISIPAGQSSADLTFTAIEDTDVETSEVILVAIESISGENLSAQNAKVVEFKILDNDSVAVNLDLATNIMDEAKGFSTLLATLPHPVAANVSVNLSYSGTASIEQDYTNTAKTIVIEPGETSKSLMLMAKQDTKPEESETIIINIDSTTGVNTTVGSVTTQTVTLTDDDQSGPVNYGISIDIPLINKANQKTFAFNLHNATVGNFYDYIITDVNSNQINAQGEVTQVEQIIDNIDVSALEDGPISLELRLVDNQNIVGSPAQEKIKKNTTTPIYDIREPKNDAIITTATPKLILGFDNLMQTGSGNKNKIEIKNQLNDEVVMSFSANEQEESVELFGSTVTINLPQALEEGCYYVMIAEDTFIDIEGNNFAGMDSNKYWRFSYEAEQTINATQTTESDLEQTSNSCP